MNRAKSIMGLTLAATMTLVSACGSSGASEKGPAGSASPAASPAAAKGEPYELTMAYAMLGDVPKDLGLVEAEISKITKEKINATVKLKAIPIGQWAQQRNLMLASNEKMDLMVLDFGTYSSFAAKNQLTDLTELIDKHGKGIKDALGSFLDVSKIKGKIYAVPTKKVSEGGTAIAMRKDLLDKHGIDISKIKSTDDLDQVFQKIKEKEPEMMALAASNTNMTNISLVDSLNYDTLTDSLGVLFYNDSMKVVNLFETPEYAAALKKVRSWYNAGYLPKDAATTKVSAKDQVKSGKAFANVTTDGPTAAEKETGNAGTEMVTVHLQKPMWTSQVVLGLMWGIPVTNTKNPTKALEFLNLTYSDKDIINLINFGIEGKHYTKKSENIITPVPGETGYTMRQPFMFGNAWLTYLLDTEDPAAREQGKAFEASMGKSKALGFMPDTEPVKTEIVAVNNVVAQYKVALETGSVDPDKVLPDFITKLKAAGIDKIVAEKQKQLDEWAASNKK